MATTNIQGDTRSYKKSGARDKFAKGYFGGKGQDGVYQTIINQIPPCVDYWELFAGDASIHKHLNPKPQRCILVEKDHAQAKRLAKKLGLRPDQVCTFDSFMIYIIPYQKSGTFVVWGCALELMMLFGMEYMDTPDSYFFVDPPYLLDTRTSTRRYTHELTDTEHVLLLNFLRQFKNANIGITTYPNPTYSAVLQQWRKVEYKAVTHGGTVRIEELWTNYDQPKVLQDTRHIGADYREREAYRKQQKNWLKNFKSMHPHQQQVIINQLNQAYNFTDNDTL